MGNKGNGAVGQHQQCTWRNALEIKPNIWSEPFDRAIGEDDGGEEEDGYDVDHQIRKNFVDDDDIYIMMQCLSVTKNDHFLLGVSCNHLNPHNHPVQLQVSFDGSRLVFSWFHVL